MNPIPNNKLSIEELKAKEAEAIKVAEELEGRQQIPQDEFEETPEPKVTPEKESEEETPEEETLKEEETSEEEEVELPG